MNNIGQDGTTALDETRKGTKARERRWKQCSPPRRSSATRLAREGWPVACRGLLIKARAARRRVELSTVVVEEGDRRLERVHPSDARVREWMTEAPAPLPGLSFWRDTAVCELAWETGALEPCPQDACTFWWEDECVLAGLAEGIAEEPERARLFLALREKLAAAEAERSLSALPGF